MAPKFQTLTVYEEDSRRVCIARQRRYEIRMKLDYFECRFNDAFRSFRIDLVRAAKKEMSACESLPVEARDSEDDVRSNPHIPHRPATQAGELATADLLAQLSPESEGLLFFVATHGLQAESKDPKEVTAATLCKVWSHDANMASTGERFPFAIISRRRYE